MPIAPQNTARPINKQRLETFYNELDRQLSNPQSMSDAMLTVDNPSFYPELYERDTVTLVFTVLAERLNESEQAAMVEAYKRASWKQVKVISEAQAPGKGYETVIMLRTIPEVMN